MNIPLPASNCDPGSSHSSTPNPGPAHLPSGMERFESLCCVLGWQGIAELWRFVPVLTRHWGWLGNLCPVRAASVSAPNMGFGLCGSGWGNCRLSLGPVPHLCPTTTHSDAMRWLWITLVGEWLSMMLIARLKSLPFPQPFCTALAG